MDVTLQVCRRENVIFDGEGKKEGKEHLKESFWTKIPSWIFMKIKESGNTEACFKLSSLNPRWLFFSRFLPQSLEIRGCPSVPSSLDILL